MIFVKTVQNLDVYLFSLFLLALISGKNLGNPSGKSPQSRVFSILIFLNFAIIIADCVAVLFNRHQGTAIRMLLMGSTVFGFCTQVTICLFWLLYARAMVFYNRKSRRIILAIQALPALGCIAIAILSCWTGWFFRYDGANRYERGPLFLLVAGISYLYIVLGYFLIIRYRKNLDKRHFAALMSFALPPCVAGVVQTFLYGVNLIWASTTFSLLIIYMAIQNESLLLDYLTGINNRRSFEQELRRRIANAKNSSPFALMLVDLDNFRSINDRYGHVECDEALRSFAKILGRCFGRNDFIARFEGDEFAVIAAMNRLQDLHLIGSRLQGRIDEWNHSSGKPWKLSVSIGSAPYIPSEKLSMDNFVAQVDKLLCLDKIVPGERRFRGRRRL